eukprot:4749407-Prymnesium_polylepis.1
MPASIATPPSPPLSAPPPPPPSPPPSYFRTPSPSPPPPSSQLHTCTSFASSVATCRSRAAVGSIVVCVFACGLRLVFL